MNTKHSRKTIADESSDETRTSIQAPLSQLTDSYRRQLALVGEVAGAMLRSSAAIQELQQRTVQQVTERLTSVPHKHRADQSPSEVLAAQAKYWAFDSDLAREYWHDLTAAISQVHSDLSNCATNLLKEQSNGPLKTLAESWQTMLAKSFNADPRTAS